MTQNKPVRHQNKKHGKNISWKPVLIAVIGIVLFGLAILSFRKNTNPDLTNEGSGTAILTVDKDTVDLGDVKLDQLVQVSFQLTNSGDNTLSFSKAPYIEVAEGC